MRLLTSAHHPLHRGGFTVVQHGKQSLTNRVPVQWTVTREGSTERNHYLAIGEMQTNPSFSAIKMNSSERMGSFLYEGFEPSECNSPVDCCSRGLDRAKPLFRHRRNANKSLLLRHKKEHIRTDAFFFTSKIGLHSRFFRTLLPFPQTCIDLSRIPFDYAVNNCPDQ